MVKLLSSSFEDEAHKETSYSMVENRSDKYYHNKWKRRICGIDGKKVFCFPNLAHVFGVDFKD